MSSELELLRQRISELEAKNAKLEAEKAELLKQVMEKDAKRDAENTELKSRVGELEARLAILEQGVTEATGQPQNDKETKAEVRVCLSKSLISAVDVAGSMVDQQNHANIKLMEEIPKVSDKEKYDLVPEEPANSPNDKTNNAILEVTVPEEMKNII